MSQNTYPPYYDCIHVLRDMGYIKEGNNGYACIKRFDNGATIMFKPQSYSCYMETTAYLWGKDDNDLGKPALLRHKAVHRDDIEAAEAELLQEYEQLIQTRGEQS